MTLVQADCLEYLQGLPANTLDSLITDPPAGISFMGKAWDHHKGGRNEWIAWMTQIMQECRRVLRPGAHGLVWAIPRTSHWTATALENAGFEVRDVITHLFGSGFPKSLDISKAIDKLIEAVPHDASKQWRGWGTALKPAAEMWILVRKPCAEKTIAANVLEWGCGGINIDASRIGDEERTYSINAAVVGGNFGNGANQPADERAHATVTGRFPANLILDEEAAAMLGEPSRFFYCHKASKSERGKGNNHPCVKSQKLMQYLIKLITPPGGTVLDPFMGSGSTGVAAKALGFNFLGIEKEKEYYEIAEVRIGR